jgi:hypothetical protein
VIYTGTKKQCEAYNDLVTKGQKYSGTTTHWANIRKHPKKAVYCIPKHPNYESEMTLLETLPNDWQQTDEL